MSHRAGDSERRKEHRQDQKSAENYAVELAREVALRVETGLGRDPRDDVRRKSVDDAADNGAGNRADAADR